MAIDQRNGSLNGQPWGWQVRLVNETYHTSPYFGELRHSVSRWSSTHLDAGAAVQEAIGIFNGEVQSLRQQAQVRDQQEAQRRAEEEQRQRQAAATAAAIEANNEAQQSQAEATSEAIDLADASTSAANEVISDAVDQTTQFAEAAVEEQGQTARTAIIGEAVTADKAIAAATESALAGFDLKNLPLPAQIGLLIGGAIILYNVAK